MKAILSKLFLICKFKDKKYGKNLEKFGKNYEEKNYPVGLVGLAFFNSGLLLKSKYVTDQLKILELVHSYNFFLILNNILYT